MTGYLCDEELPVIDQWYKECEAIQEVCNEDHACYPYCKEFNTSPMGNQTLCTDQC